GEAADPCRVRAGHHERAGPARGWGRTVNADGAAGVARRCLFRRRIADRDEETVLFGVAGHSELVGSEWQPRIPRPYLARAVPCQPDSERLHLAALVA